MVQIANIMANTNIAKRQKTFRTIWGVIEKYRTIKKMTVPELATKTRCSQQTIYNRNDRPEDIRLDELLQYKDALDIPDRELAEAIIGKRIIQMED